MQVFLTMSLLVAEAQAAFVLHGTRGTCIGHRSDVQEKQLLQGMSPNDPSFVITDSEKQGTLITQYLQYRQFCPLPTIPDQFKVDYQFKTIILSLQYSLDKNSIGRRIPIHGWSPSSYSKYQISGPRKI